MADPGDHVSEFMDNIDQVAAKAPLYVLDGISRSLTAAHESTRSALRDVRSDVLLAEDSAAYLNHAEAELREAVRRLEGARFAVEALVRKRAAS